MSGFSYVPMSLPPDAVTYHDIFEAKYVTKYLEDYVDSHTYSGKSLRDRIMFKVKVLKLDKTSGSRTITAQDNENKEATYDACRLVLATGHTTIPNMPSIPGQNQHQGPVLHRKELGKATAAIFASDSYEVVTILGGGKSAADMVYDAVKAGKRVNWIVRKTGEGPASFAGAAGKGPYRNGPEIAATRIFSALSPSCFARITWWTKLIHGTTFGRRLVANIWSGADQACRDLPRFNDREGALSGFENLKSSTMSVRLSSSSRTQSNICTASSGLRVHLE